MGIMANHTPNIEALADDLVILGDLCGTKHRSYEARLKCGEQATRKRSVGFSLGCLGSQLFVF